jgi:hypothetical protein
LSDHGILAPSAAADLQLTTRHLLQPNVLREDLQSELDGLSDSRHAVPSPPHPHTNHRAHSLPGEGRG